jgi:hypothetical protein
MGNKRIASLLSLLLCVATAVIWVRSKYNVDEKGVGHFLAISYDGSLSVSQFVPDGLTDIYFFYWKWTLLFALLPALWVLIWWLKRRRSTQGRCPACHYDLTGNTSGVCPECGTAVKVVA